LGFLTNLAREWGDVVGFRVYHVRCLLVNDPELIHEVLGPIADEMRKPWDVRRLRLVLGDGLLTSEGALWRRQRDLIQPAFRHDRLVRYGDVMTAAADECLERWPDGGELEIHDEMARLALTVAARALFGSEVSGREETIGAALATFMDRFEDLVMGHTPFPWWVPTPGNLRSRRAVKRLRGIVEELVEDARPAAGERDDLLGWLLTAEDEEGRSMSDEQVLDEATTLLLAGHETTALALTWTLHLLAEHPEIQECAADEARWVLEGRAPAPSDLGELPYVKQAFHESMRLYPPAWGLGREPRREVELGGYRVRKGTQIYMCPWVTHRDARFFPEPERFLPHRWTKGSGAGVERRAYFPFGGGPRNCVGAGFATMEAHLVLARLLQRFRFRPVPGHPVEVQPAVTLRPRHGLRLRVGRRA
ncbi:MAG: cytochrome P450, partial [Gemmatimonadetes bacterium]|nr:cytochrome P450 [Gemmatimonadota bacterium]NIR76871.1 cytochrome P450 [Gemmatimonadota bacterium]NIT85395.1 cytochrome P450 [Gemmatimonadota bacterium]NIU29211.1 cytochrome P450 [Gemmatimonadota bacterium]NIU34308.1 cytochrome P450 [Gemmatimonadota bacterium]